MRKYTTLLFDADMTLLDFNRSMGEALKELFLFAGIGYSLEKENLYETINTGYWKRLEKGEVTREEVRVNRFRDFFAAIGYQGITPLAAADYYMEALGSHGHLLPGAREMLDELKGDFSFYMITNGSKTVQVRRLKETGLTPYFEEIFISEEIGAEKPTKEFFDKVLPRIREKDLSKMVIIGDSLTSDMKSGANTGIDTIWYNPDRKENNTGILPTYTAASFEEVILFARSEVKNA